MNTSKAKTPKIIFDVGARRVVEAALKYGRLPDHAALDELAYAAIAYANKTINKGWLAANAKKKGPARSRIRDATR